ncbi:MAG: CRISPR-associated helicase Cas3' [Microthrixaceae bacterium]|nr:CRISPR-associated helicase Cas3' [Microthrixaceae bacterium]
MAQSVDFAIWGKSRGLPRPYPLLAHLADTAAVAMALVEDHLPAGLRRRLVGEGADVVVRRVAFTAGLHDLGKATPVFQQEDREAASQLDSSGYPFPAGQPLRHDHATQLALPEALAACGLKHELGGPLSGALGVACALGGHHGRFHALTPGENVATVRRRVQVTFPRLGVGAWAMQREAHVQLLRSAVGADGVLEVDDGPALVLLAGLVVVSDWLASQERVLGDASEWPKWESVDWTRWVAQRRDLAPELIRSAGLGAATFVVGSFGAMFEMSPRPLQSSVERRLNEFRDSPGVLVVTAPMGIGKTEAALLATRLLGGSDCGLYFALPTMATADAMFERVMQYAGRTGYGDVAVALAHGFALLSEAYLGLPEASADPITDDDPAGTGDSGRVVATQWLRGRQRALLAPIAAGTIDQLLAAALRSRRGFLRLFGLAGKAVVIDEAHSLDAYMHGLLCLVLEWLGSLRVPVVILSATLPSRISRELVQAWCNGAKVLPPEAPVPYPGWLHVDARTEGAAHERVTAPSVELQVEAVVVHEWEANWTDRLRERLGAVESDGCALVVCNTVSDAQEAAEALRPWAEGGGIPLLCVHARFRHGERKALTKRILDSFGPEGKGGARRGVVVATQVVEQSLDVDFDMVVSCLAPVAQLLQRAGRGHRHERPRPVGLDQPRLVVLVPALAGDVLAVPRSWQYVYPHVYLQRTWNLALEQGQRPVIRLPDDVQDLVDHVYGDLADPDLDLDESQLLEQLDREWLEGHLHPTSRIPTPSGLRALSELTADRDEDLVLATRLGVSNGLVACCFTEGTDIYLDDTLKTPLPAAADKAGTRAVLGACVPLRQGRLLDALIAGAEQRPAAWEASPWLRDVAVLALDPSTRSASIDGWDITLDPLVGFRARRRT